MAFMNVGSKFANQYGSWPAFWLFGGDDIPCMSGGGYGNEIDIAELWSLNTKKIGHTIHWYYPGIYYDTSYIHQEKSYKYTWNSTDWHIYKLIWTPTSIKYFIDGILKNTVNNTGQEWYPSFTLSVILSQQIEDPDGPDVIAPQTTYFDWVRVKEFFLAPEIDCPEVICTSDTASLDVDENAYDIEWNLSPGYLFTGSTSGTGKTVNISASGYYNGTGRITYTFKMPPSNESFTAVKEFGVKGPRFEDISFEVYKSTGELANCINGFWLLCSNTTYHIYVSNDLSSCSTSNYSWTVPGAWTQYYTYQNMISINTNSSPGGPISVNANTCCNNNVTIISGYMVTDYNCGYYYMTFTPNPVTNETTVEILKGSEEKKNDISAGDLQELQNMEWKIDVFDQNQILKFSRDKVKGNKCKINVQGWKKGIYYVRVIVEDEIISGRLSVE